MSVVSSARRKGNALMAFKVGETVVYPHHGAALIEEIKNRKIRGEEKMYLRLKVAQGDLTIEVLDPRVVWCGDLVWNGLFPNFVDATPSRQTAHVRRLLAPIRPGLPTDPATRMGSLISQAQLDKVLHYIGAGLEDGARIVVGGGRPSDPALARGFYIEPTVFADVTPQMRIAREEIFGPVLSVLQWHDEAAMFEAVNGVDYGLTASVFTKNLVAAHRAAARLQAGYVWINDTSEHFLGAPFGGFKRSGLGREESMDELLAYTQIKNVNVLLED